MDFLAEHIYLTGSLLFGCFWLMVLLRTRQWKEMAIVGVVFGVGAVLIGQFYALHDYWHPTYLLGSSFPLEDFLYGFFFGGTLASVYDVLHRPVRFESEPLHVTYALYGLFVTAVSFVVVVDVLHWNSIIAHVVPPLLVGLLILFSHRYLLIPMLTCMLLSVVITFIVFQLLLLIDPFVIEKIWLLENLSGIMVLSIPVEEYIFAAALGFGTPFFYEAVRGRLPRYIKI